MKYLIGFVVGIAVSLAWPTSADHKFGYVQQSVVSALKSLDDRVTALEKKSSAR